MKIGDQNNGDTKVLGLFIEGFIKDNDLTGVTVENVSDNSFVKYLLKSGIEAEVYIDDNGAIKVEGRLDSSPLGQALKTLSQKGVSVIYGSNKKVKPAYQGFKSALDNTLSSRMKKLNKLLESASAKEVEAITTSVLGPVGALGIAAAKAVVKSASKGSSSVKGVGDSKSRILYKSKVKDNALFDDLSKFIDVTTLIKLLQRALAEELQAWYQYWIAAPFLVGEERKNVEDLFYKNAKDELDDHANKLINRLNELGADTQAIATPDMWKNIAVCKFDPAIPGYKVYDLLKQNVEAERCAIKTYQEICDFTRGKDPVSYAMARQILKDEQEHLTDLEEFVNDIDSINVNK